MGTLVPNPAVLADDALAGLCQAHPRLLQRVHGGVVRAGTSPEGEVAAVLGGGSGHYPAFAGWVGPGLAHGAACGNFFASPSASQVYAVCRAADNGGGIVLSFGNYAGDVLHFGQAAERLRAEGVDVRVVPVTDDIASRGPDEPLQRRGIAGDLLVAKAAGAAAAGGAGLDEVEAVARRANDRTRSLGVAFSGCTLPGADAPLFELPEGQMAVGLGIHGEPGIEHRPRGTTTEVADLLVDGVLAEEPPRGEGGYERRVAVLVNGLGATGHEELLAVHARVAGRLEQAGLTVVGAVVGEQVTSLDMAGISLSMMFLDDELERCWLAPCDSPAFKRSAPSGEPFVARGVDDLGQEQPVEPGAPVSQALARTVREGLAAVSTVLREHAGALGDMDAVAGDGDHGQGMDMGSTAALAGADKALEQGAGARTLLVRAGDAWAEGAGGTSGALWGAALTAAASVLGDDRAADDRSVVGAVRAGADAILRLGGAVPGDKTMVDALVPFADALEEHVAAGEPLTQAWAAAAATARGAAEETADIVARRGRSRTHGDRSLGTPDPGAISFALVVETVAGLLTDDPRSNTP